MSGSTKATLVDADKKADAASKQLESNLVKKLLNKRKRQRVQKKTTAKAVVKIEA